MYGCHLAFRPQVKASSECPENRRSVVSVQATSTTVPFHTPVVFIYVLADRLPCRLGHCASVIDIKLYVYASVIELNIKLKDTKQLTI